jgi:hypothetical protein
LLSQFSPAEVPHSLVVCLFSRAVSAGPLSFRRTKDSCLNTALTESAKDFLPDPNLFLHLTLLT